MRVLRRFFDSLSFLFTPLSRDLQGLKETNDQMIDQCEEIERLLKKMDRQLDAIIKESALRDKYTKEA